MEQTLDQFLRYHIKILLGDFNAKVRQEDIFKPTIGKESLRKISNDNGVRLVNFATSKKLIAKSSSAPSIKAQPSSITSHVHRFSNTGKQ